MVDKEFKQGDILRFKKSNLYLTIHRDGKWDYIHNDDDFPKATFTISKIENKFNFQVSDPDGLNLGWLSNDIDNGAKYIYVNPEILVNKRGWEIEGNKDGFYMKHTTENKWIKNVDKGYCYEFTDKKDEAAYFVAENRW